jgi:ubiquilin
MNLEQMQQVMQMLGGGSPSDFSGGLGGFGRAGAEPAAPADTRPPEVRYEEQLRQLNDMGFFDFDRNVAALRRSGGSVQGAVEYLLSSS